MIPYKLGLKNRIFKNSFIFRSIFSRYFESRMSGAVVSLYINRIIQQVAGGLLALFLPVFLLQKYNSINLVLVWFLVGYILYVFLSAWGAIIATRISFKNALILSVFSGVCYYVCFYFFDKNILLFSILTIIFLNIDRMFYWVPYHSGFAKFTDRKSRGKTIAILASSAALIGAIIPILSGLIITYYGFNVLFLIVIIIYAISAFPFFTMPSINEYYTFSYWQTWKILLHPRDRRLLFTYMADGAENMIGVVIWPIFIWQLLNGDYKAVGMVFSLVVLVTILGRLIFGDYADRFNKKKLIKYGTFLYSIGWIVKIFVQTGFQIFVVSAYHNLALAAMRTPYDILVYEKTADAGHYVDEYSVLREMSLNIGRIFIVLFLLFLFNFFGLNYAFVFAAIAVLIFNLL